MKKNKKEEEKIRPLTPEELEQEEKLYQACKTPVKIGWGIYAFAATLYICSGLFAKAAVDKIPVKPEPVDALAEYRESDEYNEFIRQTQYEALDKLTAGEISIEEYNDVVETLSSDKKFEGFLRTLEDDKEVQKVISDYDKYAEQMNVLGKKYSGCQITSLSSLLIATIILAKYRFREMDIEEKRKKRAEQDVFEEFGK